MHSISNTEVYLSTYPKGNALSRIYLWIRGRHWWVIGLAALILLLFEAYDFIFNHKDFIHIIEFSLYLLLLLVIGWLVDLSIRDVNIQTQTQKILKFKHKLSLEISGYQDWDVLANQLARVPDTVAPVDQTCLFVFDPISNQFASAAEWNSCGETELVPGSMELCRKYVGDKTGARLVFGHCDSEAMEGDPASKAEKYCLPIQYSENLLGVLQFRLKPGETLNNEQEDIFRNISDELALALKAGRDRKAFYEMLTSETALAERRSVSHYLHDHLGQNLGYLHIKMDQLITEKDQLSLEKVFEDLMMMRNAVKDSYEIVRGVLETIRPETAPVLTNLLLEHARKVSQRANFEMDFKTKGKPVHLPKEVQRAVFYAFEESLSNAEKHAKASRIEILAEWGQDYFMLTISDNGIGFDPHSVNTGQHFGMEILNERMAQVNGRITLTTSENSGTIVNIHVPKSSIDQFGVRL